MSCSTSPRMSAGFHAERAPRAGTTPWPRCDPGQAHRPAALQPERAGASRGSRTPTVRAASAAAAGHGYTLTADGEITQLAEYVGPFSARAGRSPGISTGTRPSGAPPMPVGNRGRRYAAPGMAAPGPTTGRTRSSLPRVDRVQGSRTPTVCNPNHRSSARTRVLICKCRSTPVRIPGPRRVVPHRGGVELLHRDLHLPTSRPNPRGRVVREPGQDLGRGPILRCLVRGGDVGA